MILSNGVLEQFCFGYLSSCAVYLNIKSERNEWYTKFIGLWIFKPAVKLQ